MGNAESVLANLEMDRDKGEVYEDWTMTPGELDGVPVTVFSAAHPPVSRKRPYIERALQASRVLRHPGLLKYIDGGIVGGEVVVVTEHATPLLHYDLSKLSPLHVSASLLSILQTLVFMHDRAGVSHNNLSGASIFVTTTGSWKLWGLEYSCSFGELNRDHIEHINSYCHESSIPPDDKSRISPAYQHARDSYAFACLAQQILENEHIRELPGASEFLSLVKINGLSPEWSSRPRLSLLANHHFFRHDFLKMNENLTNILLLPEDTREQFIKSLADCLRRYPEDLVSSTMASALLSRPLLLQPATITHLMPAVLTPKSSNAETNNSDGLFSPETFERDIVPPLVELYSVHDATVRQVLLTHLQNYVKFIPKDKLRQEVLPELLLGIRDCNDSLVSATLHALAHLVPILGANTVIGTNRQNLFTTNKPKSLPLPHSSSRLSNSSGRHSFKSKCLQDLGESQIGPPVLPPRIGSYNFEANISSDVASFSNINLDNVSCTEIPERSDPDGDEDRSSNGGSNNQSCDHIDDEESGQWSDWEDNKGDPQIQPLETVKKNAHQFEKTTSIIEDKTATTMKFIDTTEKDKDAINEHKDKIKIEIDKNENAENFNHINSAMKVSGINYKNISLKKHQNVISNKPVELGKEYDIMAIKINKKRDEELDLFADLVPSLSTKKYDLESMLMEADNIQSPSVFATLAGIDFDAFDKVGDAWGDEDDFISHNSLEIESPKEKLKSSPMSKNYFSSDHKAQANMEELQNNGNKLTNTDTTFFNSIVSDPLLTSVSDNKVKDPWEDDWGNDF